MQQKRLNFIQSKQSLLDERSIIRSLHCVHKQDGNFTSKRIKLYSCVSSVHDRTVRSVFNKHGYHYLQARHKGLLTENDLKLRTKLIKDFMCYKSTMTMGCCRLEHAFI